MNAAQPATDWWQTNAEHLTHVTDWTAQGARPAGQPGEVTRHSHAWSYPAVKDAEGTVWFWRDTERSAARWIAAPPRLAESFTPGAEWQADCDHQHAVPWRTCDTETDCASLRREDERTWGR